MAAAEAASAARVDKAAAASNDADSTPTLPVRDEATDKEDRELGEVLQKMREEVDKKGTLKLPAPPEEAAAEGELKMMSLYQRDAYSIFSYLCKLSSQDLPANLQPDSKALQELKFCLEVKKMLLVKCADVLKACDPFVVLMKEQLCPSLIKNSMSAYPDIFRLSLQIWVVLIKSFRDRLKVELGIFIEQIVGKILDSGSSTYEFKHRVLQQVIFKMSEDPVIMIELFLNYDCDEHECNLVEGIIERTSKIAQGRYAAAEHAGTIEPKQEQLLRRIAFQSLVKLMSSLVNWAQQVQTQEAAHPERSVVTPSRSPEDVANAPVSAEDHDAEDDNEDQSDTMSTGTGVSGTDPMSLVKRKQKKKELQEGVTKFNMKPKKGIEQLRHCGFITEDPMSLAEFFKRTDVALDKTAVGDYLGENKPFNLKVMNCLVDSLEFCDQELDGALRTFLQIFRLPGEAQKIERLMEKFADKYVGDNPSKFQNADTAFVLSFAMIMLQTDLNNPQVKNKMTKAQFLSNNRGIDDGKDLPKEYLESIYDSVKREPFSLPEDEDQKQRQESRDAKGAAQKEALFQKETQTILKRSSVLMDQRTAKQNSSAYYQAHSAQYIRPFFELACWPMLATLSVVIECQDEQAAIDDCMKGFKYSIMIAARFDMDTEREAIVGSLAKYTYLTTIKEMKAKNIDCIKTLLDVALGEGNNLGPSWGFVFHCVSQLERYQMIKNRAREDYSFFTTDSDPSPKSAGSFNGIMSQNLTPTSNPNGKVIKRRTYGTGISTTVPVDAEVELGNSESITAHIDAQKIDKLFNNSPSLDSNAIYHFVAALAKVSREELQSVDQPRIFASQKLVEVASYNMGRPATVFSRLWSVLKGHFIEAALHQNQKIGEFSVDNLRQLGGKCFARKELEEYQGDILEPFEMIICKRNAGESRPLKEMIVESVRTLVQANINRMQDKGWTKLFVILKAAAKEHDSKDISISAFAMLEQIFEKHSKVFAENFRDGIAALAGLGQCKADMATSLKAVKYMAKAADGLAASDKAGEKDGGSSPSGSETDDADRRLEYWLLLLNNLTSLVSDPKVPGEVRNVALKEVYNCLHTHGAAIFDENMWHTMFKSLIRPLFQDISDQLHRGDRTLEKTLANVVMKGLKEMPQEHFAKCLPEVFPMLCQLISVEAPDLRIAVQDIFVNKVSPLVAQLPRAPLRAKSGETPT